MKCCYFLYVWFLGIAITSHAQGIDFQTALNWNQILKKARIENKYIFVDAYATWCVPCSEMDKDVFSKKEVGDFINNRFIPVKIQMDRTANDNEQVRSWYSVADNIWKTADITAFPTLLIYSADGKLTHKLVGFRFPETLIADAGDALKPENQYYTQLELYRSGNKDTGFLKQFAYLAFKTGEVQTAENVASGYINTLPESELFKAENLSFAYHFINSTKNKMFNIFQKQPRKVNAVLGDQAAEKKVRSIIGSEEIAPFVKKDSAIDWSNIEKRVKRKYGALGLEAFYSERMMYANERKDWKNFGKYYALYFKSAVTRSKWSINSLSWTIFECVNDPAVLQAAIDAMLYNIEHFDTKDGYAYDTYANLLFKAGRQQEAIEWEMKALNLIPDNKEVQTTLEKMKRSERTW